MPSTNVEQVVNFMEFSNHGPLSQLFIMEAIDRYAKQCQSISEKDWGNTMISREAWQAIANQWTTNRAKLLGE